jgi:hypothetical protein
MAWRKVLPSAAGDAQIRWYIRICSTVEDVEEYKGAIVRINPIEVYYNDRESIDLVLHQLAVAGSVIKAILYPRNPEVH